MSNLCNFDVAVLTLVLHGHSSKSDYVFNDSLILGQYNDLGMFWCHGPS